MLYIDWYTGGMLWKTLAYTDTEFMDARAEFTSQVYALVTAGVSVELDDRDELGRVATWTDTEGVCHKMAMRLFRGIF